MKEVKGRAAAVRMLVLDVDGTLTDGGIYIGATGELFKRFDIKDGLGIALWHKAGGKTAVITGRTSPILEARARELKITALWQGRLDKAVAYQELKARYGVPDEAIAYIGDDLVDLPVMQQAGFAAAPADAVPEVRQRAHFVASRPSGNGAVRETIEFILQAQGRWEEMVARFLIS